MARVIVVFLGITLTLVSCRQENSIFHSVSWRNGAPTAEEANRVEQAAKATGVFEEALLSQGRCAETGCQPERSQELIQALGAFAAQSNKTDLSRLEQFLNSNPQTYWSGPLALNLGLSYRKAGRYQRALAAFTQAWDVLKDSESSSRDGELLLALADLALAELAHLEAVLGLHEPLRALIEAHDSRPMRGRAQERWLSARAMDVTYRKNPLNMGHCGKFALEFLLQPPASPSATRTLRSNRNRTSTSPTTIVSQLQNSLERLQATERGVNLAMLAEASRQAGHTDVRLTKWSHVRAEDMTAWQALQNQPLSAQTASTGVEGVRFPVPSVALLKSGHFITLLAKRSSQNRSSAVRYLVADSIVYDRLVERTEASLLEEAAGFFLVKGSSGLSSSGLVALSGEEGARLWGKGDVTGSDGNRFAPGDRRGRRGGCATGGRPRGMPQSDFHLALVGLSLEDVPVGYSPPRGPAVYFHAFYSQRDSVQPATKYYSNLGSLWTHNYFAYVQQNPATPTAPPTVYMRGGGVETLSPGSTSTVFSPAQGSGAVTERFVSSSGVVSFVRTLTNGGTETYAHVYGSGDNTQYFLTQVTSPSGFSLAINYDGSHRISSISDALGRATTFFHESGDFYRITRVVDPFGRQAVFSYTGSRLTSITDTLSMVSTFAYGDAARPDFITAMTTPYGTTAFSYTDYLPTSDRKTLEITDPMGGRERVEFNEELVAGSGGLPSDFFSEPNRPAPLPAGMNTTDGFLDKRNVYYWSKKAMADYGADYTKAVIYHYLHKALPAGGVTFTQGSSIPGSYMTGSFQAILSGTLESIKIPGQARLFFNYPGQSNVMGEGVFHYPIAVGRLLANSSGASQEINRYTYDGYGRVLDHTDPRGRKTQYNYANFAGNVYDLANVQKMTSPTSGVTVASTTYNSYHQPLSSVDARGNTTTYQYNVDRDLQFVNPPTGWVERIELVYDSLHRVTALQNYDHVNMSTFTYDARDRVATSTSSDSHSLSYSYDDFDRVTQVTYPDTTTERYTYNRLDLSQVTFRDGRIINYTRDALRRVTQVTDPKGQNTNFTYCGCGLIRTMTDGSGTLTLNYDWLGRLTSRVLQDGGVYAMSYDSWNGRLVSVRDPKGQLKNFAYAEDGSPTQLTHSLAPDAPAETVASWNPAPNLTMSYDDIYGRMTSTQYGATLTTYGYYPSDPYLLTAASTDGVTTSGIYDTLNRITSRSLSTGMSESQSFDYLGRLATFTNSFGTSTLTHVGLTSRPSQIQYPPNVRLNLTYAPVNQDLRLSNLSYSPTGGGTPYEQRNLFRDVNGRITWAQGRNGAHWDYYAYSANHEVTRAGYYDNSNNWWDRQFTYDSAGNILWDDFWPFGGSWWWRGFNYLNAKVDWHTESSWPAWRTFTHDPNGNMTQEPSREGTTDVTYDYGWDSSNRLTKITKTVGTTVTFSQIAYDENDRFTRITDRNGGPTGPITSDLKYIWVGGSLREERYASSGVLARRFFSQGYLDGSGPSFHYVKDQLGSVMGLVSTSSGIRTASYDYDVLGKPVNPLSQPTGPGFGGYFYHAPSGLYLTHHRAYNPRIGRFISRDPIGEMGGKNPYRYVGSNFSNHTDPSGLHPGVLGAAAEAYLAYLALGAAAAWVTSRIAAHPPNIEDLFGDIFAPSPMDDAPPSGPNIEPVRDEAPGGFASGPRLPSMNANPHTPPDISDITNPCVNAIGPNNPANDNARPANDNATPETQEERILRVHDFRLRRWEREHHRSPANRPNPNESTAYDPEFWNEAVAIFRALYARAHWGYFNP